MAYNNKITDRIREALADITNVEEKIMFGGVCFMVNGKMCLGVAKDDMMCRIGPDAYEAALEKTGCREMDFTGRPMKGYVFVDETGIRNRKGLQYWIDLSLAFNTELLKPKKSKK